MAVFVLIELERREDTPLEDIVDGVQSTVLNGLCIGGSCPVTMVDVQGYGSLEDLKGEILRRVFADCGLGDWV